MGSERIGKERMGTDWNGCNGMERIGADRIGMEWNGLERL